MKKTFVAATAALSMLAAGQASATVILSQNFENATNPADPGFTTQYSYRSGAQNTGVNSMYDEGTWTINDNPFNTHNLWINTEFDSQKLILNGKAQPEGVPNTLAWQQEAEGVHSGRYSFSFDAFDVCCNSAFNSTNANSVLTFGYQLNNGGFVNLANVTTHVTPINFAEAGANGYRVTGFFDVPDFTPQPGVLQVSLFSNNGAAGGNDFAIDNILISTAAVPEPATWAMMIMGFGAAGAMLRSRRLVAVRA